MSVILSMPRVKSHKVIAKHTAMYFRSPDMAIILYRIYWKPEDRYTG